MKKLLCFAMGVFLAVCGLHAQQNVQNCVHFTEANLYPGPTLQEIYIDFKDATLDPDGKYALRYELYKNGELMSDLELADNFHLNQTTFTTNFTSSLYYGQNITHAADYFPNGYFNASSNMSSYAFNYLNAAYLNTDGVKLRLNLGWRSDRDYTGQTFMLIVKLVTMESNAQTTSQSWAYNNGNIIIGGYNAILGNTIVTLDTLTTIKYLDYELTDTICYSNADGHQYGDPNARPVTITADTIAKYAEPAGSTFAAIVPQTVTFGNHGCNARIDSIGIVNFYVWANLQVSFSSSGNVSGICAGSTAGAIKLNFEGVKSPYTLTAYRSDTENGTYSQYGNPITRNGSGTFNYKYTGLEIGWYKFTVTDATGCSVETATAYQISEVQPKAWQISTIEATDPTCHDGEDGSIHFRDNGQMYGYPVFTLLDEQDNVLSTISMNIPKNTVTDSIYRNLAAGTYKLTSIDTRGCRPANAPYTITLNNPDPLTSKDTIYACVSKLPVKYKNIDTVEFAAAGEKVVHFTSVQGCDSAVTVTLITFDNPTVNIGIMDVNQEPINKVCIGNNLHFTTNSGMSNYIWTNTPDTIQNANSETVSLNWATKGDTTITVSFEEIHSTPKGDVACYASKDTIITVNPLPDATVTTKVNGVDSSLAITACAGDTIILNAVPNPDYAYVWKHAGQNVGTEATLTIIASENIAGSYQVFLTDTAAAKATRCTAESAEITIAVNTPTASITGTGMTDVTICGVDPQNNNTTLTAAVAFNGNASYKWTNNQNNTVVEGPNEASYTVTPTDTTIYYLDLTSTIDACSVHAYDTVVVNVNNPTLTLGQLADQTLCFDYQTNEIQTTLEAVVNNYHGNLTYQWNTPTAGASVWPEDGSSVDVHATDTSIFYLTVTSDFDIDPNTPCAVTAKDTVVVNVNKPMVQLTPMTDQTICSGDNIKIYPTIVTSTLKSDETTYLWNTGETTDTITVSPTVAKDYSVIVTAKVGDCTYTAYDTVNVEVLTPSLTLGDTITGVRTICNGEQAALSVWLADAPTGEVSYLWAPTGETTRTINPTPTDTTKYIVTVTATLTGTNNQQKSCSVTAKDSVVINVNSPAITLNEIVGPDHNTICLGDTATLSVTPATQHGEVTYQWLKNDVTVGNTPTIKQTPEDDCDFTVIATATVGNCPKQATRNISIYVNKPAIEMNDIADQTICLGTEATFTASTQTLVGTVAYAWTPMDVLTENQQVPNHASMFALPENTNDINYTVVGTATVNTHGKVCTATDTVRFTLHTNDTVKLAANILADTVCAGENAIDNVVITATNATVTTSTLPDGLSIELTNTVENVRTYTISGMPTTAGEYPITITATSDKTPACTEKTLTYTLKVNPVVELTGTADTTFAVCVGADVTRNLPFTVNNATYAITGLADGISYSDNGFYGAATTVGAFRYTVTATSNQTPACAVKTLTGTITVNDTLKYTVEGPLSQDICWEDLGDTVKVIYENATVTTTIIPTTNGLGIWTSADNNGKDTVWIYRNESSKNGWHSFIISFTGSHCETSETVNGNIYIRDTVSYTIQGDTTFSVCVGSEIEPVYVTARNVSINNPFNGRGIPRGLNAPDATTYNNPIIFELNGVPDTVGVFHYTALLYNTAYIQTATGYKSCANATFTGTITVNDTVKLTVSSTNDTICLGGAITAIEITNANSDLTVTFANDESFGLSFDPSTKKITGTPTEARNIRYTVTATSNNGCGNTDKVINGLVVVKDTVKLSATNTDQEICLGGAITPIEITNANSTVNVSFDNDDNNGLAFANGMISGRPTAARNINYTITATSNNNCGDPKTITGTITVNDTTVTITTINAPATNGNSTYYVCANASETNDTITFTTASDMTNYAWNVGDGTIISGNNTNSIQVQWAAYGDKSVTVAYTNPTTGCRGTSAPAAIKVYEAPTFTVAGSAANNHLCAYADATDTLRITATNSQLPTQYAWTPNDLTGITGTNDMVFGGSNLTFGEHPYTVVATSTLFDTKQCQVTNNITIMVDTLPRLSFTVHNPRCYADENGDVIANVNGSAPFTYEWNNGCTNAENQNLRGAVDPGATFTVTVTDINGCTVTGNTVLIEPAELIVHKDSHHDVSCYGGNNGSFRVFAEGGTMFTGGLYQFLPEGGADELADTLTVEEKTEGIYTVTVYDANGCNKSISDTIEQPTQLVINENGVIITNVNCNGESNGEIELTNVTGGTPLPNGTTIGDSYTYTWEGPAGATIDNANNPAHGLGLIAGAYHITVEDANGCKADTNVTVTEPAELVATVDSTHHISCNGGNDGYIRVGVTGGTYAYTYEWISEVAGFTSSSDSIRNDLKAGAYKIVVKDAHNCTDTVEFTLTEPAAITVDPSDSMKISCNGGNNGYIHLTVANGTAPYTYAWTGPDNYSSTDEDIDDLFAGRYIVTITDANGCILKDTVDLSQPDTLKIQQVSIADITCFGLTDGRFEVSATGGTPDYRYKWDDETIYTGTVYHVDLTAGEHVIAMVDANNCVDTIRFTINEPEKLTVAHTFTNVTCYGADNGSIDVTVEGGITPYTYVWEDNASTEDRDNLPAGIYYLMVHDNNECKAYDTVTITQPEQFAITVEGTATEICADGHADFSALNTAAQNGFTYTYQWYKDGAALTDSVNTQIRNITEAGKYWVVATQSTSLCTQADTITLTVFDLPNVTVSATADTICLNGTVTFTANGADNYEWAPISSNFNANNFTDGGNTAIVTGDAAGVYVLSVTGYQQNNQLTCSKTVNDTVTVLALPTVGISGGTEVCSGSSLELKATGAATYEWSGDGLIGNYDQETVTFSMSINSSASESYTVTVTGTDNFGCQNTATHTIKVNPLPYVTLSEDHNLTAICADSAFHFSVSTDGTTIQWVKDNAELTALANTTTYRTTEAGKYVVNVTDDKGCAKTSDTLTVTVNPLPTVTLVEDHNLTDICADSIFHFTVTTNATAIQWVNTNIVLNETGATYATRNGGKYVVNVTDGNGCKNTSDTLTVKVHDLPDFDIDLSDDEICLNKTATIEIDRTDADSYTWKINDNEITNNTYNYTFNGTEAGDYTFVVTASENVTATLTCTFTDETSITVYDLPVVAVTQDTVTVCLGSDITLTATGAANYDWTAIDNLDNNVLSDDVFTANTPGYYRIEVEGTSDHNCSAKDTIVVNVKNLQNEIAITLPKDTICLNATTGFKVHETFTAYAWTEAPGQNSCLNTTTGDTVTFTGLTDGVHTITVTVTDENGCEASANTTVLVNALPTINLTATNQCLGDTVTFTTETGMEDYTWTYPTANATETLNDNNGTLKVVWSDYGNKNVTVNYTDANGCSAAEPASVLIEVYALPNVVINPGDFDTLCLGATEHITVDPQGINFVWSTGDQGAALDVTPLRDSIISVIGTDVNGCKNYDTIRFIVNDTVKFTLTNPEQQICLGNPIENMVFDTANCTLNLSSFDFTVANLEVVDDTIKGTPEHAGTYSYALEATSTAVPACFSKYINVNIYVYDTAVLNVTNAEQEMCLGNPIQAIHIDTANCTLSFNPQNLPYGLTFDGEASTITGQLGAAGEYTFDIIATPRFNPCNNPAKKETIVIVVKDTNKLACTSDNLTQEFCLGTALTDIVLDTANCTLSFEPADFAHGLSYNATTHSIVGVPDTAMVFSYTITAAAINSANGTACNADKTLSFTITVNDTAKLELLSASADQKFCFGNELEPIAFKTANGTAYMEPDLSTYGIIFANDTITGTPTEPGTFDYTIYVVNPNQCKNKEYSGTIIVDTLPVVTITANDERICPEQQTATLTATANAGFTYEWANNVAGNVNVVEVMPTTDSIFTVTVTDGNTCSNSANIEITMHTLPAITITGTDTICIGDETMLTAEYVLEANANVQTIVWANNVGADAAISVAPVADSVFTVTITDDNGCYNSASDTVVVITLPVVELTSDATSICQEDTIHFTANDAYTNYVWTDGATVIDNETTSAYNFVSTIANNATGAHKIAVRITDGHQCVNSDTINITVNPTPVLSETHNRVRCFGEENAHIDLTVNNVNDNDIASYAWSGDNNYSNTDEDIYDLGAGIYTVTVTTTAGCHATLTDTIEQPDTLIATIDDVNSIDQLCNGIGKLVVKVTGGTNPYEYLWDGDGIVSGTETSDTLQIQNLAIGDHAYTVIVTDDSNCIASIEPWYVTSTRYEVYREVNIMPGETYTHGTDVYTDQDNGATFEDVLVGVAEGGCDSVYVYTVHAFDLPFYFADDFTAVRSAYRTDYQFNPHKIGDTILTSINTDNMFYAYVMTDSTTWNGQHVDMKYEILFNDVTIASGDYDSLVDNLKISSYHEYDQRFYGHALHAATGETPATTFVYQYPSNSTAYYYDYFNFEGFNKMPQKVEFNFPEAGTYTIKFFVEQRNGVVTGNIWNIRNPRVVHGQNGPIWGGLGDNPTSRDTITARYMTVIVSGESTTASNPAISAIEDYASDAEPVVTTYPNPAHTTLYLDIKGMEGVTYITITDATGKVVASYNENLLNNETTLNYSVAKFAQGIYFLNIQNSDNVITKKFIVTK